MNHTMEAVLAYLEEHAGEYCSGTTIAEQLGVSRNAVWKAIARLQERGCAIDSAHGSGYRLAAENAVLSRSGIEQYLKTKGLSIAVYDELPSTNTALKQLAEEAACEGTVLFARRQTAGKGRLGRSFFSPQDSGIYMSILLKPNLAAQDALLITTCAAVATAQAIEAHTQKSCGIKWVNDLFCAGKKVCGILTEASLDLESGGLHYAVLGIGIDLFPTREALPRELEGIVGSIAETRDGTLLNRVAAEVLDRFFAEYPHLTEKRFLAEYRSRSILQGKTVRVLKHGAPPRPAQVLAIDDALALHVRYPDGTTEALSTGEVSIGV